ncbi:MAG: murein biosynthesis integral membrane protein MurJ, partial [Actinobacteria bacterium]|nr:murein biosynthesis integral membrane protein MurJ [Actinomycetota bacterium]NIS33254.1 murein biosynthesis integral membrane protein MurJ [Actinomycetota bacterium]NIT96621.1 murein biosynthesis integral membrane protein MurJ [Actinomycetota bacterium]NIU20312.1 murein biosynthesis integral membrane protein MurJ [Actinomycetota bacterium]NIU67998.1 murein biosynthesis integral membrane protein MurJ [Actinomycetota bacterium]
VRIPNLLQNLLGEGVLSASFVPVYSQLIDEDDPRDASRVAGAVGSLLLVVTGLGVLVLVLAARPITSVLAFGLSGERFELAVDLTRVMAVGVGFLVMSAWCLGILNSHRRFFLPYVAPVLWNAVQVIVLLFMWWRDWPLDDAARGLAIAVTVGGLAQLMVQLPTVRRLARGLRLHFDSQHPRVREVRKRFGPAVLGRGVVQISAYVDLMLATLLASGALAALFKAQLLYTLPVSLFAMSVAAAELPELSRVAADPVALVQRTQRALERIAFWMLLAAFIAVAAGDLIVGVLFQGGAFDRTDGALVWFVLAAYAVGLPAIGASRLLQNTCFAVGDTRGPARIAAVRVGIAATVGLVVMFPFDHIIVGPDGLVGAGDAWLEFGPLDEAARELEGPVRMGAVGLAIGSALGAWVELTLLSMLVRRHVPSLDDPRRSLLRPAVAGALAFALTAAIKLGVDGLPLIPEAIVVVGAGVVLYALIGHRVGVRDSRLLLAPVRRLIWR